MHRIGRTVGELGVTGHRGRAKNNFVTSPELAVPFRRRGKPGSELAVPLATSQWNEGHRRCGKTCSEMVENCS